MSALEKARVAWGADLPEWIEVLAQECDRTTQNKAAAAIGRNGSVVSQALSRKYQGNYAPIEEAVRGTLMKETVACPELGELVKRDCLDWRKKAQNFNNVNWITVRMFRACNRCPRHKGDA